jgi:hypothetical protein
MGGMLVHQDQCAIRRLGQDVGVEHLRQGAAQRVLGRERLGGAGGAGGRRREGQRQRRLGEAPQPPRGGARGRRGEAQAGRPGITHGRAHAHAQRPPQGADHGAAHGRRVAEAQLRLHGMDVHVHLAGSSSRKIAAAGWRPRSITSR